MDRVLVPRCVVHVAVVLAATAMAAPAIAQGRIANAKIETRSAAQGLDREMKAVAAQAGATWIGYRVPMVAGRRHLCCADAPMTGGTCCGICRLERGSGVTLTENETPGLRVTLEPPTEFIVLARAEAGQIVRLRTFTPDCDIEAGGMPVVWLTDVKTDDSIGWLTSLTTGAPGAGGPVAKPAIGAIALHNVALADRVLEGFIAPGSPEWLRRETAFWLGTARGEAGARVLTRMVAQDSSENVREQALFGLSVSSQPAALVTLINAARDDRSPRVRGRALFWLAQQAGRQAVDTIDSAIDRDPDTEVKKQAVFALSRLPKDDGIPKLMEVARTHKNPAVRKTAMFWLGQSKDPRAVTFFEDILTRK